jgi:hypothetical protein
MEQGRIILLLNALKSELGYEIKWDLLPDGSYGDSFRLENSDGDSHEFSGPEKFEQAMNWLRKKA